MPRDLEFIRTLVGKQPEATLEELRAELPIAVSVTTLWRALDEFKLSFKKSSAPPSKTGRTSQRRGSLGKPK